MKIVQILPGTGGGFYCENCLRDAALAKALIKRGEDVLLVPMYLPAQAELEKLLRDKPIFFGGINVYLQQKFSIFRKTPRWIDRLFDSPKLLEQLSRISGMTNASELGEATISMLKAEKGNQQKELARLINWLSKPENNPDIVYLSNLLLAGLAGPIKKATGASVVSLLQDEDGFLDGLVEPYKKQAWRLIQEKVKDVDAFISVSNYYADVMQKRLSLDNLYVVYPGIEPGDYQPQKAKPKVPTIGFLSRLCYDKGIYTLFEAFIKLKRSPELHNLRLQVAGGKTRSDKGLLNHLETRLLDAGFKSDVEFLPNLEHKGRQKFFQNITLLCVPEKRSVAFGLYVLEAFASGVPVVQPAFCVFPEIIDATGGGVTFEPNNIGALADAVKPLLLNADYAHNLGLKGRKAVRAKFDINQTAEVISRIFHKIVNSAEKG